MDLTREDGDILVVCSLLDKLCFLMVDWVCRKIKSRFFFSKIFFSFQARQSLYFKDIQVRIDLSSVSD